MPELSLEELVEFAKWLDRGGQFDSPIDAIFFFEKPWQWDLEYLEYRKYVSAA